jgi:hypothetical protein
LFQPIGIETDHRPGPHNDGWSRTAVIGADQFQNGLLVRADVLDFKIDTSLREEGFRRIAGRSTRLAENNHFLVCHVLTSVFSN